MSEATQDNAALASTSGIQIEHKIQSGSEEKAPDSSESNVIQKPKTRAKKRKKAKDTTAPRHPLTGYVRYLNDRREAVRSANPGLPFAEITKILAGEWTNLSPDKKQQYLDAAEQDRERYTREFNAYKQTDAYRIFTEQQNEKKLKEAKELSKQGTPTNKDKIDQVDVSNFDIPIFTEEFLDHNKAREAELRQLRKSTTNYEQQNALLQKHIDNMKDAIIKLEDEIQQQEKNNCSLQKHLDHLRVTLVQGFSNVRLPGISEMATEQNIDEYMTHLHSILLQNSSHDSILIKTVRNIVGGLEFNA